MSGISPVISAAIKIQARVRGQQLRNKQLRNKQLFEAAESGDISEVKNLLAREADVNVKGEFGGTALHWAADHGFAEIVQLLLDSGADIKATDNTGRTALHWAVTTEIVQLLLKAGAKTDVIDSLGDTPLHCAAYFHCAAYYGSADNVQALVIAGADVNARNNIGYTALDWAARKGKTEVVKALVIAGADVNATDNDGWTALQFAKYYGHYDKVKNAIKEGKNELIKLHQDKLNKYQKKQDQLPGYIKFVLKQSLEGTSEVTRTIVQFIEKPLSKSQKEQVKKYIEEREAAAATKIQKRINE